MAVRAMALVKASRASESGAEAAMPRTALRQKAPKNSKRRING